jgi:hypothetical protein
MLYLLDSHQNFYLLAFWDGEISWRPPVSDLGSKGISDKILDPKLRKKAAEEQGVLYSAFSSIYVVFSAWHPMPLPEILF